MSEQGKSKDIAKKRLLSVVETQRAGIAKKDAELILSDMEKLLSSYFELAGGDFVIERRRGFSGSPARRLVYTADIIRLKRGGIRL